MHGDIRYNGKMTDQIPAWVMVTVVNYGNKPAMYTKVSEYLKANHNRKKMKIESVDIIKIENLSDLPVGTRVFRVDGSYGGFYGYEVETMIEIDKTSYVIIQKGRIQVSEGISQVMSNHVILYKDNEIILEVN